MQQVVSSVMKMKPGMLSVSGEDENVPKKFSRIYGGKKVSAAIAAMFIMNTMNEKNSARFSFCEILPRSVERRSSDEIRESRMRHSTHSAIGNRVKLLTKLVVIQRSPIGSSRLRTDGV